MEIVNTLPFTGSAAWVGTSSCWSGSGNWTDGNNHPGVPGTASRPADTAAFSGSGSVTAITLDANPSLAALSFSGTNYTLSGGSLTMNAASGTATVTVSSGTQTIQSAMEISGGSMVLGVSNSGVLRTSGNISDDGNQRSLTLTGDGSGALILSGTANSYTGGTNVDAGTLYATNSNALADGSSLAVGAGGTLIFDPSVGGSSMGAAALRAASPDRTVAPVPEPGTLALLSVLGVVAAAAAAWRRKRTAR
jgi:autotransporter-associated beta strand protein